MATYQNIKGLRVKYLSADPSTATDGEVWYNSTSGTLKARVLGTAAWSSGGNVVSGRINPACLGIQTASMMMGGHTPSGDSGLSETYDGTTWSEGNNLVINMDMAAGAGTQTAGLCFGGNQSPDTETVEYDGTNWTEAGSLNTGKSGICGAGTQTAGLKFGGYPASNLTEEYNGTAWSSTAPGGNLGTARYASIGFGTQTAALMTTGDAGPANTSATEEYNGASWSAGTAYPGSGTYAAGCGTQTAGLGFSGGIPYPSGYGVSCNAYDGSAWTVQPNLATAGGRSQGAGTQALGLMASGGPPAGRQAASEEFNGAVVEAQTLTTS